MKRDIPSDGLLKDLILQEIILDLPFGFQYTTFLLKTRWKSGI